MSVYMVVASSFKAMAHRGCVKITESSATSSMDVGFLL